MLKELKRLLAFFEGIAEHEWVINNYRGRVKHENMYIDAYCALGHMYIRDNSFCENTPAHKREAMLPDNTQFIYDLFHYCKSKGLVSKTCEQDPCPTTKTLDRVNDGRDMDYKQSTPKARVIAFTTDLINMMEIEEKEAIKELMDEEATEAVKELVEESQLVEA